MKLTPEQERKNTIHAIDIAIHVLQHFIAQEVTNNRITWVEAQTLMSALKTIAEKNRRHT